MAALQGLSASSLAKLAGLDATAFNPSKRITRDSRLRWPSVETITKVSEATGVSLGEIVALAEGTQIRTRPMPVAHVISKDDAITLDEEMDKAEALSLEDPQAFVLVMDVDMSPKYRVGTRLVVSPNTPAAVGDVCAAMSATGRLHIGRVTAVRSKMLTIEGFNGEEPETFNRVNLEWFGRILWASE